MKEKAYKKKEEDDEPIDYFANILPRIRAAHPDLKIWDFVQYPGESNRWQCGDNLPSPKLTCCVGGFAQARRSSCRRAGGTLC